MSEEFAEPPWRKELDAAQELQLVPPAAKISGMFLMPLVNELKRIEPDLPAAKQRYVAFNFYPLRDHVELLIETARRVFPDRPLRQALRALGRGAPNAFTASTLGRVVLGSTEGVEARLAAIAKGYELNMRPGKGAIIESAARRIVVRLEAVHYFLDCHHVGVFEGTIKQAGVAGRVLYAQRGTATADFAIEW